MELWDGQKQFSCIISLVVAHAFIGPRPNTAVPVQSGQHIAGEGSLIPGPVQGTGNRVVLLLGRAPCQTADNPASLCFPPL